MRLVYICFLCCFAAVLGVEAALPNLSIAAEAFTPLELRQVELGGELGRRIDVTINNNLMKLDLEKDFLQPFRERGKDSGFVGVGMLIDAAVGLAAYSGDTEVIERKQYLIDALLCTQDDDGYIDMIRPESRMWNLWDIHEMSYIIQGLVRDYRLFGEKRSLEAARKVASDQGDRCCLMKGSSTEECVRLGRNGKKQGTTTTDDADQSCPFGNREISGVTPSTGG